MAVWAVVAEGGRVALDELFFVAAAGVLHCHRSDKCKNAVLVSVRAGFYFGNTISWKRHDNPELQRPPALVQAHVAPFF